jgi:hypothetical protein
MRRVYFLILLALAFSLGLRAQMTNNIPNYLYSGALGVGRNVANDANTYLQVGPNGAATKGVLMPRVADTASITGTKRNGLLIYSNQLAAYAYYDSASVAWRKIGYTDTTVISTRAYAQNILDDSSSVLRALVNTIPTAPSWGSITGTLSAQTDLQTALNAKQATLVSATNIKTINGSTLLGSGDLSVGGSRLDQITGATTTAIPNHAGNVIEWQWNTLTTRGLYLTSTSTAATGSATNSLFDIGRTGANANSSVITNGLKINVANTGTTSTNYGLYIDAAGATTNYGIRSAGTSYGVYGLSLGASGRGVWGYTNGASSTSVEATNAATSGTNYGVNSVANGVGATTNYGGYFTASGATNNYGVRGEGTQRGVMGVSTSSSGLGGYFQSSGAGGSGGYFSASGSGTIKGIDVSANNASATTTYGASILVGSTSGISYAVNANANGAATTNYGGYFTASSATNNYALVVPTSGGNIGFGTITPVASALVEMSSTAQGFLLPRMTKTQRDAISSPATGLMVYQTDNTPGLRVWNGTNWMRYTETAD